MADYHKPNMENGVAWNDDCCVVELVASKHWTHQQPRAEIEVEEL
jgi:Holliday junction resolvase RusA-like endonuclease